MPLVLGPVVDNETRCVHYHLLLDVIAIKFKCCGRSIPATSAMKNARPIQLKNGPRQSWLRPRSFFVAAVSCCSLFLSTWDMGTGACHVERTLTQAVQTIMIYTLMWRRRRRELRTRSNSRALLVLVFFLMFS